MNGINRLKLREILSYEGIEDLISSESWEELFNRLVIEDIQVLFNALQIAEIYPFTLAPNNFYWDDFAENLRKLKRGLITGVFAHWFPDDNDEFTFDILTNIAKLGQLLGVKYIYQTTFKDANQPDYLFSDRPIERLLKSSNWEYMDYEPEDFNRVIFEDI